MIASGLKSLNAGHIGRIMQWFADLGSMVDGGYLGPPMDRV